LILRLPAGPQRVLVRSGTLERLGTRVRAITIEPVQATLDAIEVAAQTDLVRVLTHEILNSLTPVTSLSETAVGLLASDSPDLRDARLAVGTLARRAAGLHRFIKSYRAVASPPVPHKRHFEAAPFAAELARLFAAEWPNHQLCSEVADGARIFADPDLFAQALINLLRNAAQAAGTGARIRLGIAEVKNGSTIIEVEDNGPGIPEELRREVFLPFFTTRAEGTGVGLNLVRQIMVAHGWQVSVTTGELGGALVRLSSS
jgi:signal transduction histidine kinase